MKRKRLRQALAATTAFLCLAAVGVGLALVGGPRDARMVREDEARLARLHDIAAALRCDRAGETLPVALSPASLRDWCGGRSVEANLLDDPFGGRPVRYERRSDRDFRLCTGFHDAERLADESFRGALIGGFDPQSGCLLGRMDG